MKRFISSFNEGRILLVAPTGNDAANAAEVLGDNHFAVQCCQDVAGLCKHLRHGAAALVIAEEALTRVETAILVDVLEAQPAWSDIPLIIIGSPGKIVPQTPLNLFGDRTNLTVLERPLSAVMLVSTLRTALRARSRQYEVKELLREREKHMKEREALFQAEKSARQEAESANRMKDEFLATVSHELRNPLNSILGFTQLLRKGGKTSQEIDRGLEIIERNAKAQAALIEDLLDISRVVSGNLRLIIERHDLLQILKSAIESIRPTALAKDVQIEELYVAGDYSLRGDSTRLQQIIWNLLSNAVKFSRKGGHIKIILKHKRSSMVLQVVDNGVGIEKEFLPFVFDRFRQEKQKINRSVMGLGLGLSIAKQLTEMQGGKLVAYSAGAGKGATFTLSFPVLKETALASKPGRQDAIAIPSYESLVKTISLKGIKVLAVDDEADSRDLIQNLLEECGARVVVAGSAAEALDMLKEHRPDILLSDLGMPIEDGFSLIAKVRSLDSAQLAAVPAIALTAFARPEDKVRTLESGFQAHVSKPVAAAELTEMIASLFRRQTYSPVVTGTQTEVG